MKLTLSFTPEQLQTIDRALQEIPFRVAAPLIADINKQIAEQQQKAPPDPDPFNAPGQEI